MKKIGLSTCDIRDIGVFAREKQTLGIIHCFAIQRFSTRGEFKAFRNPWTKPNVIALKRSSADLLNRQCRNVQAWTDGKVFHLNKPAEGDACIIGMCKKNILSLKFTVK